MKEKSVPSSENKVIDDIRNIIKVGRTSAYEALNASMVETYWKIGKRIVEEEQNGKDRAIYGTQLINTLAKEPKHSPKARIKNSCISISHSFC